MLSCTGDCQVEITFDWDAVDAPVPYCLESTNCQQVFWTTEDFVNNKEPLEPTQCGEVYLAGTADVVSTGDYTEDAPGYKGALANAFLY